MLLAIDTSLGTSVAIVDGGVVLAERSDVDSRRHAEVIGDFIAGVLADAGVSVPELSAVVVGMGPGPFTGLRVGIAAARAFAFGAGIPVLAVVSHDAVAFGHPRPVLVVTDARRREVYWSAYAGSDAVGLPMRTSGPGLARPDDLVVTVADHAAFEHLEATEIPAGSLGLLAESMLAHGRGFASEEPLYLRSPDVTVSKGPKRVTP